MKTRNVSNYLIATLVILCSLVLFGTLVFALTGFRVRPSGRTLTIDFRDVTGIQPGSPVRLAGKPAGQVLEIRHLSAEERRSLDDPGFILRVTVELDEDVPELGADVRAGIGSESFLGGKFVALTPGSLSAPPLDEEAVLQATGQGLMETLQKAASSMDAVLAKLNNDYDQLLPRLSGLLQHADMLVIQGTNLMVNMDQAAINLEGLTGQVQRDYRAEYGPQLTSILGQVQTIGTNLNRTILDLNTNTTSTLDQVQSLLRSNEANLEKMIAELRVVAQNLKVVSTYAKALTGQLGEKPSRLIWGWGRGKMELPTEQEILDKSEPIEIPLDPSKQKK